MATWFSKKPRITPVKPEEVDSLRQQPSRMQGLWAKCEECNEII
jgi:acetyl-CoA carboxylase carboxyl transferase subunit beta